MVFGVVSGVEGAFWKQQSIKWHQSIGGVHLLAQRSLGLLLGSP